MRSLIKLIIIITKENEVIYIAGNRILQENLPLSIIKETYNKKEKYTRIKGYRLKTKNDRYLNFIKNGFKCSKCGIEGKYVNLEFCQRLGIHLNVYGIKDGKSILLTKDHIYPKSKRRIR